MIKKKKSLYLKLKLLSKGVKQNDSKKSFNGERTVK